MGKTPPPPPREKLRRVLVKCASTALSVAQVSSGISLSVPKSRGSEIIINGAMSLFVVVFVVVVAGGRVLSLEVVKPVLVPLS